MSFSLLNKILLILSCLVFLFACNGTKGVYESLKEPKYAIPFVENLDDQGIIFNPLDDNKISYENGITLTELKNKTQYHKVVINNDGDKVFALSNDNSLLEFVLSTGQLVSSKTINILNIADEIVVSLNYLNNSLIIALKSGTILNVNFDGDIIWKFENNKILNTPLFIFDDQILALYVDEINSISSKNGKLIWDENYNDLPVYQAKGGDLVNFLNLLFFILPNNRVGSIDLNFGREHDFVFNKMPLISSINNIEDKIHTFDNYFTYLDEGKYLYTVNILTNDFTIFKKNINSYSSNIFFNNSIILKEGSYLHAININNGKSFWLIESNEISIKSKIIAIRSFEDNIEIFLNNGDILLINNKELIEINNLDINNIKSIVFGKMNIVVKTDNGKTVIF